MYRRGLAIGAILAAAAAQLPADFSYQETTKITGGVLVGAMKVAGVFSKDARQLREPQQSTVSVKGDRLVHRGATHMQVIDLGAQTITIADLQKKTYSVMTFEEMKQAMERAAEKMKGKDSKGEMKFKVSAESTGKTKQVAGFETKEMLVKMEMIGKDKESGQSGAMVVNMDSWIAPQVPGYDEVQKFYKRMAEKVAWAPGGNIFMNRPDMVEGMAEVQKETAKLEGMPVLQFVNMGPQGTPPPTGEPVAAQPEKQGDKPSVGNAIGSALGGKFGLGRKKAEPPPQTQSSNQQQPSGALVEMQTEMSGFSAAPVDASQFEVPAGFKKVEADMKRMQ